MSFGPVRRALLALAIGGFGIGTGEFVMLGPAAQRRRRPARLRSRAAGHLISAYALGVVVGAPAADAASVRYSRKAVLIALIGMVRVGNFASAIAP